MNGVKSSPNPNLLRCLTVQFKRVLPECFLRSLSGLSVLGCQDDNYAGLSPSLKGNDALKIFQFTLTRQIVVFDLTAFVSCDSFNVYFTCRLN